MRAKRSREGWKLSGEQGKKGHYRPPCQITHPCRQATVERNGTGCRIVGLFIIRSGPRPNRRLAWRGPDHA